MNKAIDWKRSHSRSSWDNIELDTNLIDINSPIPDELIIKQENHNQIQTICETLPPIYERVIILFYYENKSYQQIAKEEGISLKTVESRLYRARSLIRQRWMEGQA